MNLTEISSTQRFDVVTANNNFEAVKSAAVLGIKRATTVALTLGLYGGMFWTGSAFSDLADTTVALTGSATNYVEANRTTGAVTVNQSAFTAGRIRLYAITTNANGITGVTDYRTLHLQGGNLDVGTLTASKLTIASGTLTDNDPALSITQTWNDAADTFVGASIDITDTASAAASVLLRGRIGGSDRFSFSKAGALTLAAGLVATTAVFSGIVGHAAGAVGAPSFYFTGSPTTGLYQTAADELAISIAGANAITVVASQRTLFGSVASYPISTSALVPRVQIHGTTQSNATLGLYNWTNDDNPPVLALGKSKSGTVGTHSTAVADGTDLAQIRIQASDGDEFRIAALLFWEAVATIANNQTPCRATMQTANASGTVTTRMIWDQLGSVVVGSAAIATNATDGFLYIPSCTGTPTGAPTAYTGRLPLVIDSTNHKLYFYSGSWRDAGP